jgi:FHA domain
MTDPRLLSMHLESAPRRDDFRRARQRVQGALGSHTLAGDIRQIQGESGDNTCAPDASPSAAANGVCWLLDHGRQIPLKVGLNSIGRLPDNDVVIDDATVSRRHCAIVVHSDLSVELHDVASKNGTTINGSKMGGPTRLKDGDEITLCERRLTFVMKSGAPTVDRPLSRNSHLADDRTLAG